MSDDTNITVSVVSHCQGAMVNELLKDLARFSADGIDVLLTINAPEQLPFSPDEFPFPLQIHHNASPRGFAANHNAAFKLCRTKYFAVLNPDLRLTSNPFPVLADCLNDGFSVAAPTVLNARGEIEDSARKFPRPHLLLAKLLGLSQGRYPVKSGETLSSPDWVAGMFMLFRAEDFAGVGGFDEGFFLYYEDADICTRLWKRGLRVGYCQNVSVIHQAQRASRHKLKYLRWHLASMARYFGKHGGRLPGSSRLVSKAASDSLHE